MHVLTYGDLNYQRKFGMSHLLAVTCSIVQIECDRMLILKSTYHSFSLFIELFCWYINARSVQHTRPQLFAFQN